MTARMASRLAWGLFAVDVASLAAGFAALAALVLRFRRSTGDERQQIRGTTVVGTLPARALEVAG